MADTAVEACNAGAALCAGAAIGNWLGVDGAHLVWAFIGASAGIFAGKTLPRPMALGLFVMVGPVAAVLGRWAAVRWMPGEDVLTLGHLFAGGLAFALPFLLAALRAQLEARSGDLVGAALDKVLKGSGGASNDDHHGA